jgi:hypothetical protein
MNPSAVATLIAWNERAAFARIAEDCECPDIQTVGGCRDPDRGPIAGR